MTQLAGRLQQGYPRHSRRLLLPLGYPQQEKSALHLKALLVMILLVQISQAPDLLADYRIQDA